jgi:hypothetical protein
MVGTGKLGNKKNLAVASVNGNAGNKAASLEFSLRVLPMIQAFKLSGKSMNVIASQLNSMNVPTARGGSWAATTVSRVLASASASNKQESINVA